jgi:hypothetical protein
MYSSAANINSQIAMADLHCHHYLQQQEHPHAYTSVGTMLGRWQHHIPHNRDEQERDSASALLALDSAWLGCDSAGF